LMHLKILLLMALNIQKKVVGLLNQSHRIIRAKCSYFSAIKSKDGKELFVDTSSLSYDMIMNMFKNLSKSDDYFDN